MYLQFFGLTEKPFHSTPDPRFLYTSPSHREALAALIYGVEQRQGFATIVGEVGVGKTTILRAFLEHVNGELDRTIYIYNSNLTFKALLQRILDELDQEPCSHDVESMIQQLQDVLIAQYRKEGTIVLLIDEAQNMPVNTLENLRMLSNIETTTDKLLQIILIGQPELDTVLQENSLRQLRQRITLRTVILPLTKAESLAYIQHRLAKSGVKLETVFESKAVNLIIRTAEGVPRRLNILCDNVLLTGFGYSQKPIPVKTVKEVIADIEGEYSDGIRKWALASIAALLAIVTIPWVVGTQDIFSTRSPKDNEPTHQLLTKKDHPNAPTSIQEHQLTNNQRDVVKTEQISSALALPSSVTDLSLALDEPAPFTPNNDSFETNGQKTQEMGKKQTTQYTSEIAQVIRREENNSDQRKKLSTVYHAPQAELNSMDTTPLELSLRGNSKNLSNKPRQKSQSDIFTKSSTHHRNNPSTLTLTDSSLSRLQKTQTYTIKNGDTLDSLLRTVYGRSSPTRMKQVLYHNPHIKSPSRLYPGQELTFPIEDRE